MNPIYHIYGTTVRIVFSLLKGWRQTFGGDRQKKIDRFISAQSEWMELSEKDFATGKNVKTIWFHASSLGEYQIARPIISALKAKGERRVILTFFSSTGVDALRGKKTEADIMMALPLDTVGNSRDFLDRIQPDTAVFMVSEYWPNYLRELRKREIPVILYSALMRKEIGKKGIKAAFKKKMVQSFDTIICHDALSEDNLKSMGCNDVRLLADPLFDNALSRAESTYHDPVIEKFCDGSKDILIAGSLHTDQDLVMVSQLARKFPETKIILVPHETGDEDIEEVMGEMPSSTTILYSEAEKVTDWTGVKCLVIDFVGALSKIYRYGKGAYVGGGFTRLLHSVIEPMAYGIPVAFGPMVYRKAIPGVMVELGIGTVVRNSGDLEEWWRKIIEGVISLDEIKRNAKELCEANIGGAVAAVEVIEEKIGR